MAETNKQIGWKARAPVRACRTYLVRTMNQAAMARHPYILTMSVPCMENPTRGNDVSARQLQPVSDQTSSYCGQENKTWSQFFWYKAKAPRSNISKEKGQWDQNKVMRVVAYCVGFTSSSSICIRGVLHFVETTAPECSCWGKSLSQLPISHLLRD